MHTYGDGIVDVLCWLFFDAIAGNVMGYVATSYQHLAVFYVRLVPQSDFVVHVREPCQRGDPDDESLRTKSTKWIAQFQNLERLAAFVDNWHQHRIMVLFFRATSKGTCSEHFHAENDVSTDWNEVSTIPLHITYFMHQHRMNNNAFFWVRAFFVERSSKSPRVS